MEEPQTKPNFDCSICLDVASQPVVTLCGHLYCWPCMYKWLEHQTKTETPQQCPVCKASLSQTALVPLYGRGREDSKPESIPDRPAYRQERRESVPLERRTLSPLRRVRGLEDYIEANARSLHGMHQLLPWCFCGEEGYSSPYYVDGGEADSRQLRREMEARVSLHRISTFLFMCVVACWLLF